MKDVPSTLRNDIQHNLKKLLQQLHEIKAFCNAFHYSKLCFIFTGNLDFTGSTIKYLCIYSLHDFNLKVNTTLPLTERVKKKTQGGIFLSHGKKKSSIIQNILFHMQI